MGLFLFTSYSLLTTNYLCASQTPSLQSLQSDLVSQVHVPTQPHESMRHPDIQSTINVIPDRNPAPDMSVSAIIAPPRYPVVRSTPALRHFGIQSMTTPTSSMSPSSTRYLPRLRLSYIEIAISPPKNLPQILIKSITETIANNTLPIIAVFFIVILTTS